MALGLTDWVITEAGFGFDLGAEKFFDIKCQSAGLDTAAVVLVATCRALKMHGGVSKDKLTEKNTEALQKGLANLDKHVENIDKFCEPPVVCLNRFATDHDEEIELIRNHCLNKLRVPFAVSNHFEEGGKGGVELAQAVMKHAEKGSIPFARSTTGRKTLKPKSGKWRTACTARRTSFTPKRRSAI